MRWPRFDRKREDCGGMYYFFTILSVNEYYKAFIQASIVQPKGIIKTQIKSYYTNPIYTWDWTPWRSGTIKNWLLLMMATSMDQSNSNSFDVPSNRTKFKVAIYFPRNIKNSTYCDNIAWNLGSLSLILWTIGHHMEAQWRLPFFKFPTRCHGACHDYRPCSCMAPWHPTPGILIPITLFCIYRDVSEGDRLAQGAEPYKQIPPKDSRIKDSSYTDTVCPALWPYHFVSLYVMCSRTQRLLS